MFKTILIVCVGNICRSPMAEHVLKQMMQKQNMHIQISSAGLGALVGHSADEKALEVMDEQGIDGSKHKARQLNEELVKQNELILVMENWQQKEIESLYPFARGRVHRLGKWLKDGPNGEPVETEISDPYKKPKQAFVEAYKKIDQACAEWCKKLC